MLNKEYSQGGEEGVVEDNNSPAYFDYAEYSNYKPPEVAPTPSGGPSETTKAKQVSICDFEPTSDQSAESLSNAAPSSTPVGGTAADQKATWQAENQNSALKDHCKKHFQPILKIIDPDFAGSCTRCLRETFLKKDHDTLRNQIFVDIGEMQEGFQRLMDEFGIRSNVKTEFCSFTTNIIQQAMESLDSKYQQMRQKIVEKFELKVLQKADQIEAFATEFSQLRQVVESHAQTANRSLFQVFVDNLISPQRIQCHRINLHSLQSPLQTRQAFAETLQKIDKNSQSIFNGFFEEFTTILDGQIVAQTKVGGKRGRKRLDKTTLQEGDTATVQQPQTSAPEYFTYGETTQQEPVQKSVIPPTVDPPMNNNPSQPRKRGRPRKQVTAPAGLLNPETPADSSSGVKRHPFLEDDVNQKYNLNNSDNLASRVLNQFFQPSTGQDQNAPAATGKEDDELENLMEPQAPKSQREKESSEESPKPEIEFPLLESLEQCKIEFQEALMMGQAHDPNVYVIDLCENKPAKDVTLIFYHVGRRVILHTKTFELSKKLWVQVVCNQSHIFFVERQLQPLERSQPRQQTLRIYMYKRSKPKDLMQHQLTPELFKIERVFVHFNSKGIRPLCLVHQRWVFVMVPGYKSFAFDFITLRHIEFCKLPALTKVNSSVDAKIMVLNDRDLAVVTAPPNKPREKAANDSEILVMDMHQLSSWKRIKIREDMRCGQLINFAIIPFVKEDQVKECIMVLGGSQATTQTYVWDEKSPEVVRTCIHTEHRDRFLTNVFHKWTGPGGERMAMCFGMSRVHVFDNNATNWTSLPYAFDENSATQTMHTQLPNYETLEQQNQIEAEEDLLNENPYQANISDLQEQAEDEDDEMSQEQTVVADPAQMIDITQIQLQQEVEPARSLLESLERKVGVIQKQQQVQQRLQARAPSSRPVSSTEKEKETVAAKQVNSNAEQKKQQTFDATQISNIDDLLL